MTVIQLYKKTQQRVLSWAGTVSHNKVVIEHGEYRGKQQTDVLEYPSAQEATTELERRAAIKTTKQGYTTSFPENVPKLPMLASEYAPSKLPATVYIQPKLDGIRCVGTTHLMVTRRGECINSMPHIKAELATIPSNYRLDGELYCHGRSFQDHLSLIKREELHPEHTDITYNVFDLQRPNDPFTKRLELLEALFTEFKFEHIKLVPSYLRRLAEVPSFAKDYYSDYEGVILRNPNGLYHFNHRSVDLQKYKWTQTAECEIIDIVAPTRGRAEGAAIFVCLHPETKKVFRVVPKQSIYIRKSVYMMRDTFKGYWARVTYEGLSTAGKPLKPRADAYSYRKEDLQ